MATASGESENRRRGRYQELIELAAIDFSNEDTDADFRRVLTVADGLRQAHPDSNYAAIGAGIVAAQAVERGDFDLAVSQLTRGGTIGVA